MPKQRFKFSANISNLFWEMDFPARIAAAAEAGFDGVEVPLPYDHPAPDLRDKCVFAGISCLRIDAPPPNYTGGPQGYAALPGLEDRFRRDFGRVARHAQVLGVNRLLLRSGLESDASLDVLTANLHWAAKEAPKMLLLIEPLNPQDHPSNALSDFADAASIIEEVAAPNVKLAFSTWHGSRSGKGLAGAWEIAAPHTGHVLVGGGGASDETHRAQAMIALLEISDYSGWICADYLPSGPTKRSLSWLPK